MSENTRKQVTAPICTFIRNRRDEHGERGETDAIRAAFLGIPPIVIAEAQTEVDIDTTEGLVAVHREDD